MATSGDLTWPPMGTFSWPWTRRAADRFGVSVTTAQRWSRRYWAHGKDGMRDRSSRPRHCPRQLARRTERRILGLRVSRRWGPARIAYRLRLNAATVHKVLTRHGARRCPGPTRPPAPDADTATRVGKFGEQPWGLSASGIKLEDPCPHHQPAEGPPSSSSSCSTNLAPCRGKEITEAVSHDPDAQGSSTTPSMTTPGSHTARSSPTNARRPPARSGPARTRTSPRAGSPSNGS